MDKRHLRIVVFYSTVKHFLEIVDLHSEDVGTRHSKNVIHQFPDVQVDNRLSRLRLMFVDGSLFLDDIFIGFRLHHAIFQELGHVILSTLQRSTS